MNESSNDRPNDSSGGLAAGSAAPERHGVLNDHTPGADAPPIRLGALDVEAYLGDPNRKQQFVTPMFDVIAPRYDAFTRLFSFGMDAAWKREALDAAVAAVKSRTRLAALDLACGTGDIAVALAVALPGLRVTGVDASPRMIQEAEQRLRLAAEDAAIPGSASLPAHVRDRIDVRVGDMMALDAGSASIDIVTAGYGVRNVPDAAVAVREMARVLRPGGTLVTLDFYRPELSLWRALLLGYLTVAGNLVGWLWHRDPVVYGYISRSIEHFMSWQAFSALLEREGFVVDRVVRHLGGGIALHVATRR
ncbi:MAG: class I SAM-dependent methyltransferase [Gemmatimonadaceae bacterium]